MIDRQNPVAYVDQQLARLARETDHLGGADRRSFLKKAGAPTLGDRGLEVNGYTGDTGLMPPKGGHAQLNDAEVGNAVRFMPESSGLIVEASP